MQSIERKPGEWPVEVYAATDQGTVRLWVHEHERDELDRLLARDIWPAPWKAKADRGPALVHLTRLVALSISGLAKRSGLAADLR
jgi:hypothetical protein